VVVVFVITERCSNYNKQLQWRQWYERICEF